MPVSVMTPTMNPAMAITAVTDSTPVAPACERLPDSGGASTYVERSEEGRVRTGQCGGPGPRPGRRSCPEMRKTTIAMSELKWYP